MKVKPSKAFSILSKYIKAGIVPMLTGSPGCGKSQIFQQIADFYNLKLIDLRLSQCDPCDLLGFPSITGDKAGYKPMDTFPIEGDPIPEGYSGWFLFFDEFNGASRAVQAAAYKVILDRMIGTYKLHKNVAMGCAGNLDTDNAIVEPMSTALQSRMAHLELGVDADEFCNHAASQGWDYRINSWINFKPGMVYTFKPDHTDKTYACPRTYEFANKLLKTVDLADPDMLPLMSGVLSEGIAREMLTYFKVHEGIVKIPAIIKDPENIPIPSEQGIVFALSSSISHHANETNLTPLMKFVKRLPAEYQVVCLRETVRRNKELFKHEAIQNWVSTSAIELF